MIGAFLFLIEWTCVVGMAGSIVFALTSEPIWFVAALACAAVGLWARWLAASDQRYRVVRRWVDMP